MGRENQQAEFDYQGFPGFPDPHWTQVPDLLLDFMLPDLSGAELKVLLYLIRRTYGFKKDGDSITLSQLCSGIRRADQTVIDRGTGLSRSSVTRAVKRLEELNLIEVVRDSTAIGDAEVNYYRIRRLQNEGGGGFKIEPPLSHFDTGVVSKSNHRVVSKSNHQEQETVEQETEQQQQAAAPMKQNETPPRSQPLDTSVVANYFTPKTTNDITQRLAALGVAKTTARNLLKQYDPNLVYRWLCYTEHKLKAGWTPNESPAAWLVSAIRSEDWVIPDWFQTPEEQQAAQEQTKQVAINEHKRRAQAEAQERKEAEAQRRAMEKALGVGEKERKLWQQTLDLLQERGQMTPALFSAYLLPLKDSTAIIATPVEFFCEVIPRHEETIQTALEQVTGSSVQRIKVRHVEGI